MTDYQQSHNFSRLCRLSRASRLSRLCRTSRLSRTSRETARCLLVSRSPRSPKVMGYRYFFTHSRLANVFFFDRINMIKVY